MEFKILCSTHKACPIVMNKLKELGFDGVKETFESPSYDISAKINLENEKEIKPIATKLFKECGSRVREIVVRYT
ncbi:MAG: hypothetical protein ACRD90_00125 [Nitrosopumilaceae archaeon]